MKFQTEPYYCSQNINKLIPKPIFKKWNYKIAYYLVTNIQKFVSLYDGQQGGYKLDDIKNHKIQLPIKNSDLDFKFMEEFINELEAVRICELEAYFLTTGIKDYTLTKAEEKVLNNFKDIEWSKFNLGVLFEKIKTNKLPFKADELPKQIIGEYSIPCLTSSFKNQGLNYFVPKNGATILKNVISIPSNSDIYRAYFQSNEFTVLSDAYAIEWILDNIKLSPYQYLFTVQCINKVTDLPIYSYKNKLGGWNVVKTKYIQLPVKDEKPDYEKMETIMSAIYKLVIKDVFLFVENKKKSI